MSEKLYGYTLGGGYVGGVYQRNGVISLQDIAAIIEAAKRKKDVPTLRRCAAQFRAEGTIRGNTSAMLVDEIIRETEAT